MIKRISREKKEKPAQRQISKNNNHEYLVFSKMLVNQFHAYYPSKARRSKNPPPLEQSPRQENHTWKPLRPIRYPLEQIGKLLEWRVHRRLSSPLSSMSVVEKSREFSTILEAFVASPPVERDVGISANVFPPRLSSKPSS